MLSSIPARAETMVDELIYSDKISKVILGTNAKNPGVVEMLDKTTNPRQQTIPWYQPNTEPLPTGNPSPSWIAPVLEYTILVYGNVGCIHSIIMRTPLNRHYLLGRIITLEIQDHILPILA